MLLACCCWDIDFARWQLLNKSWKVFFGFANDLFCLVKDPERKKWSLHYLDFCKELTKANLKMRFVRDCCKRMPRAGLQMFAYALIILSEKNTGK